MNGETNIFHYLACFYVNKIIFTITVDNNIVSMVVYTNIQIGNCDKVCFFTSR